MTEQRSRTEALSEAWPIYARLSGLGIGLVEMVGGLLGLPVSTPILGFAGGLLLAPKIAGAQTRRNDLRKAAAAVIAGDQEDEEQGA